MFIDYAAMLLVNMVAGYMLLAAFVVRGLDSSDHRHWAPGFAMVGTIAFVFGGIMCVTWPLPGPYSSMYGELSVLFGVIFLGAALAMASGWSLLTVALYAFFAGIPAVITGSTVLYLGLTKFPWLAGPGFILSGFAGIMAGPTYRYLRTNMPFRLAAAALLVLIALIWMANGYPEYFAHYGPNAFGKWMPPTMHALAGK